MTKLDFQKNFSKKTFRYFYISFEIDTLGRAGNYPVINELSPGTSQAVITLLQSLPNYWLVAKKGGKSYDVNLIIAVSITVAKDGKVMPAQNKPMKGVNLFYSYYMRFIQVTREVRSIGY